MFVGPQPILFSRDPLASEAALAARPEAIKRGLLLLLHRIAKGVPVHLDEALAVVEQPREGDGLRPFGLRPTPPTETPGPAGKPSRAPDPEDHADPQERPGGPSGTHDHEAGSGKHTAPTRKTTRQGTIKPEDSESSRKYGKSNVPRMVMANWSRLADESKYFMDENLKNVFVNLLGGSLASSTWKRYQSAVNLWQRFESVVGNDDDKLKMSVFISWCFGVRGLKGATISMYVSALENLGRLSGLPNWDTGKEDKALLKVLLRGTKNLVRGKPRPPSRPVTLKLLRILGRLIKEANWSEISKRVVWAVCTTAYWGSFRLGELLPGDTKHFDRFSALLGKDVRWEGEELKFTIRSPKVVGRGEETVLLVPVVGEISCPVRAVRRMERAVRRLGLSDADRPYFRLKSGRALTKPRFLSALNSILTRAGEGKISGKSFRAGLPTDLGNVGKAKGRLIQSLGRWAGNSFRCYVRSGLTGQREARGKAVRTVLNEEILQARKNKRGENGSASSARASRKGKTPLTPLTETPEKKRRSRRRPSVS